MGLRDITGAIIGAAVNVHRELGPGLLESSYEACMYHELLQMGLTVERQKKLPLVYKGVDMQTGYRLDLLVNNAVVVELKSVARIEGIHVAAVLTYLKLSGYPVALLINYNVTTLRDGIRRIAL